MDRLSPIDSSQIIPKLIYPVGSRLIRKTIFDSNAYLTAPFSCYEFAHSWNPSCFGASFDLFKGALYQSANTYGSLYLITALLKRKNLKYFLTRLPIEILQSTIFLAAHVFFFMGFYCFGHRFTGKTSYLGLLITDIPACFISIMIERKQRRGLLALYLTNLALETAFNMCVDRKWTSVIPNGHVMLFSSVSSLYVYLYCSKLLKDKSSNSLLKRLIGSDADKFSIKGCFIGFAKNFSTGFAIQLAFSLSSSLKRLVKDPKILGKLLLHKDNFLLGLFLGFYRLIIALVNYLQPKSPLTTLLSGYFAGWSMLFYKSSSITLYLSIKLVEILWFLGIDSGKLPYYRHFDIILYTLSAAFVLWIGVYEPQNIRQAYWKFIVKISSGKFADLNRRLVDSFGCQSSKLYPKWRPTYVSSLSNL
jgi:hypothetical protein